MMKNSFLSFCLAALLLIPAGTVQAERGNESAVHTVSVQGSGSYSTAPDRASISIGVTSYADTAAEAQQQNAAIATAIRTKLESLGIDSNNIQTKDYSFYPVYSNDINHANEIKGYNADNTVYVTVDDVKILGEIIDGSIACGANKINAIDFTVKSPQKIQQKALQAAVRDAREKADILANAAGKRIKDVLSINESRTHIQSRSLENIAFSKVAADTRTPIESGDVDVQASVQIEFIMD
jgi:Uncharacterized conserved protein